ncbi:16327_t:CDS:2, partial [Funneliformis mosseae]
VSLIVVYLLSRLPVTSGNPRYLAFHIAEPVVQALFLSLVYCDIMLPTPVCAYLSVQHLVTPAADVW